MEFSLWKISGSRAVKQRNTSAWLTELSCNGQKKAASPRTGCPGRPASPGGSSGQSWTLLL